MEEGIGPSCDKALENKARGDMGAMPVVRMEVSRGFLWRLSNTQSGYRTSNFPDHQGPLPIPPEPGVLPHRGLERLHSLPGTLSDTTHDRPPTGHTRRNQGMGSTRGLAHLHTRPRHPGGMAPLWGRYRGRGESSLHQTHRPPPSPHDPQPLAGGPRRRHNPPRSRTTGPQHMPTLDTPPDGYANEHEHAPVEPPAASPPLRTTPHTHQPHVPGGRACGGPLRRPPPAPRGHHQHYRPRRGLHHHSIRHPLTNAGPSPQQSTPRPFLQLPEWPQYRLFHQYLTRTARAVGHTLAGSTDMRAAYRDFKKQHLRPIPVTPPYAPTGSKHETVPPVTGPVPPLMLLLAPKPNPRRPPSSTTGQNDAYGSTT